MHPVLRACSLALLTVLVLMHPVPSAQGASDRENILIGRIAHVEGQLLRYIEEEKDWVQTVQDAPFGLEDALYAGDNTKAELIMPNGTWMRIGEHTQVQLINLDSDATTVDVASGLARLYNRSTNTVIKATTPFGYVVAPAGSGCDLYVGDESLEVIAVRGEVDFVHEATGRRYPIREGGDSLIADRQTTARGNGTVDGPWDDWNGQRERVWAERQRARSASAQFLPEPIRENAYVLEDYGRWERVYYDGDYRDMWRPTRIESGWRPYTSGRWVVYYGDNCWIPDDEPFGYVTHHYGSWVYVDSFRSWYWMPPVVHRHRSTPKQFTGFGWYPGRVGWLHHRDSIGWVPLAPHEPYYGHRPWGHHTMLIHRGKPKPYRLDRYRYLDEAVVIPRDHFYRGHRYTPYVDRTVNKAVLINNYKPTTVINKTVINNFNTDKRRFAFGDDEVGRKPHMMVGQRIDSNRRLIQDPGRLNRDRIERDLRRVRVGAEPPDRGEVRTPTLTPKLVDADKVKAPIDKAALPQREIKPQERQRRVPLGERPAFDLHRPEGEAQGQPDGRTPDQAKEGRPQQPGVPEAGVAQPARDRALGEERTTPARQPEQRLRSPRERQQQQTEGAAAGQRQDRGPTPPDQQRLQRKRGLLDREQPQSQQSPEEQDSGQQLRRPADRTPSGVQPGRGETRSQEGVKQQRSQPGAPQEQRFRAPEEGQEQQRQPILDNQRQPEWNRQLQQRKQQQEAEQQRQEGLRQQQQESEQRQQQELQRRQQEKEQIRQQQIQRRQQEEAQQRQQEEMQRRQQEKEQIRQQQDMERRRQIEAEQRQQEAQRRQQQQESFQRRQQEAQVPPWQQEQQRRKQEQPQPAKKKPTPEELLQLQQQQQQ
jgi:hypothetical protein